MIKTRRILIVFVLLLSVIFTGCSTTGNDQKEVSQGNKEAYEKILNYGFALTVSKKSTTSKKEALTFYYAFITKDDKQITFMINYYDTKLESIEYQDMRIDISNENTTNYTFIGEVKSKELDFTKADESLKEICEDIGIKKSDLKGLAQHVYYLYTKGTIKTEDGL
ncbi:MAG: hypothetical protein PHH04_08525 [Thomasclavelia sp.]|jgi:hypothetical protein|nr:hypothetical protein [Thomasclavelia sp.]